VNYSSTVEEVFCSVILASYVSIPNNTGPSIDPGTTSNHLAVPLGKFPTKRANMDALISVGEVATALGVSYVALERYLAAKPDLAIGTLITFLAWTCTTKQFADGSTGYTYEVQVDRTSRFLGVEVILSVQSDGQSQLHFKGIRESSPNPEDPAGNVLTMTRASASLNGPFNRGDPVLDIPFQAFIFLVSTVHKALHINADHLRIIKAHGGYRKSEPDAYGKILIALDLDSLPLG
jgi:hypothetical protein